MLNKTYFDLEGLKTILSSFFHLLEDRQKKKRQQRQKGPAEGKTSLQRSKTFVNLLFKKDRKEKSRSKSPSHHADKGEGGSQVILHPTKQNATSGSD